MAKKSTKKKTTGKTAKGGGVTKKPPPTKKTTKKLVPTPLKKDPVTKPKSEVATKTKKKTTKGATTTKKPAPVKSTKKNEAASPKTPKKSKQNTKPVASKTKKQKPKAKKAKKGETNTTSQSQESEENASSSSKKNVNTDSTGDVPKVVRPRKSLMKALPDQLTQNSSIATSFNFANYPHLVNALRGEFLHDLYDKLVIERESKPIKPTKPKAQKSSSTSKNNNSEQKKESVSKNKAPSSSANTTEAYLRNLLTSHLHTMKKSDKNRWKLILQVEGNTRNVSINHMTTLLNVLLMTSVFNILYDLLKILGSDASPRKSIDKLDVDVLFNMYADKAMQRIY